MCEDSPFDGDQREKHHLLKDTYLSKGGGSHGDWFERMSANRPSKTIVAHIGKDTYGYFHPFENRAISIREAARIQSFPDFFSFSELGIVDAYSVIGNAVPPLLACRFASRLDQLFQNGDIFKQRSESCCGSESGDSDQQLALSLDK